MKTTIPILFVLWLPALAVVQTLPQGDMARMEKLFRELPMEAKRLTGPLFWLLGSESQERLENYVQKAAVAGRVPDGGAIDGQSLIDLAGNIKDGRLTWQALSLIPDRRIRADITAALTKVSEP